MSDRLREALRLFFNTLLLSEKDFEKVVVKSFKSEDGFYSGGGGSVGGPSLNSNRRKENELGRNGAQGGGPRN